MKAQQILQSPGSGKDSSSLSDASVSGLLRNFFEGVARDPRISCGHTGMYAALLQCWAAQQCGQPLMVFSHQVIGLAKVSSRDTYFRYVRQLSECRYIRYEPSFNRKRPSRIYLDQTAGVRAGRCKEWVCGQIKETALSVSGDPGLNACKLCGWDRYVRMSSPKYSATIDLRISLKIPGAVLLNCD